MVLKKPYAFLIKHFKLIHLLLCIPLLYLIIRVGNISSFLSDYVRSNYYTNLSNLSATFINYFMYLAIIVVILLVLSIYFLMRQKKKDTKFYLFLMLYYILLFILITFCYGILDGIETASLEAQTVRMYRDIAQIVYLPQLYFLAICILRGIGFNIKKFNFDEDVKELEITDIDNEEFEVILGKNSYKYKRTFRRFIREFGYYIKENKITFIILLSLALVALGTMVYLHFGVFNKSYKQTQRITHNNLVVQVMDSVLSNLDLGGNVITEGKYYLAVALKLKNNGNQSVTLDYENFKAEVGDRLLSATLDKATYFADLGIPYTRDTKIAPKEENVYILTYEIPSELINQKINLKILESIAIEVGSVTPIYKKVNLNYETITENQKIRQVSLGKILELSETRLGLVQIKINSYKIQKSYEYTYGNNLKNKVVSNSKKTLLIVSRLFEMDKYTNYYKARKGSNNFINDFIKIEYKDNSEEESKITTIQNKTPKELSDEWVFEIPEEATNAEQLNLLVCLRGRIYTLELKE